LIVAIFGLVLLTERKADVASLVDYIKNTSVVSGCRRTFQPNEQYEQEVDRVAEQVMSMAPSATPNIGSIPNL
jgi:hypothetical protein